MRTATQQRTEHVCTTDAEVALPDYDGAVACCGDPQPTVEQLTRALDEQVPPRITFPSDDGAEYGHPDDGGDGDRDA